MNGNGPHFSGAKLRELRLRQALSQYDLARRAGVHVRTILEAELGRRTPQPSTVRVLARALGVEPADLLEFDAAG